MKKLIFLFAFLLICITGFTQAPVIIMKNHPANKPLKRYYVVVIGDSVNVYDGAATSYGIRLGDLGQWIKDSLGVESDTSIYHSYNFYKGKFYPLTGNPSGFLTSVTGNALTKIDDTNVTLTLGGSPSNSLLQATSLTLGWIGTLADGRIASASIWNAKQDAITPGTTSQYLRGDLSLATFPVNVSTFTNDAGYLTSPGTPSLPSTQIGYGISSLLGSSNKFTYDETQGLFVTTTLANVPVLSLKQGSGMATANIFEIKDNSNAQMLGFSQNGVLTINRIGNTGLMVDGWSSLTDSVTLNYLNPAPLHKFLSLNAFDVIRTDTIKVDDIAGLQDSLNKAIHPFLWDSTGGNVHPTVNLNVQSPDTISNVDGSGRKAVSLYNVNQGFRDIGFLVLNNTVDPTENAQFAANNFEFNKGGLQYVVHPPITPVGSQGIMLPQTNANVTGNDAVMTLSVNGIGADSSGNITIPSAGPSLWDSVGGSIHNTVNIPFQHTTTTGNFSSIITNSSGMGTAGFNMTITNSGTGENINNDFNSVRSSLAYNDGSGNTGSALFSRDVLFQTSGTDGNVGVGTLAPEAKLNVNGTFKAFRQGDNGYYITVAQDTTLPSGDVMKLGIIYNDTVNGISYASGIIKTGILPSRPAVEIYDINASVVLGGYVFNPNGIMNVQGDLEADNTHFVNTLINDTITCNTLINAPLIGGDAAGNLIPVTSIPLTALNGTSGIPSIAAGAGAGTSPTVSIQGTNIGGQITVTTGTGVTLPSSSILVTVTYNSLTFANDSYPGLTAVAGSASQFLNGVTMVGVNGTTTGFTIVTGTTGLTPSTTYVWNYVVTGN